VRHVYHLYVVRSKKRDSLRTFLEERGIGTLIHYPIPVHLQQAYKHLGHAPGAFPRTEACCQEILSLPLFPELPDSDIEKVVLSIREFMELPAPRSAGTGRQEKAF
jgi:dTDP-4-amino-4,6-dideoxygalactose transaminase